MRKAIVPAAKAGVTAGVLFAAHALVPHSHAWPLVWPLLGGAAAVLIAPHTGRHRDAVDRAKIGATAGAFAAVVFLLATMVALFALDSGAMEFAARILGASDPMSLTLGAVLAIGMVALLGVAAAALGGALAGLVRRT